MQVWAIFKQSKKQLYTESLIKLYIQIFVHFFFLFLLEGKRCMDQTQTVLMVGTLM